MGMLRFSIGDVTEDRPALFIRLHFIIFWCRRPWTGPPFPSSSSWLASSRPTRLVVFHFAGCREGSYTCTIAGSLGEPRRGASLGESQRVEDPRQGRRSGFPSGNSLFLRTVSLAGMCLFRHPDKGAEKPPKEGHPLGVSYIYIHIDT